MVDFDYTRLAGKNVNIGQQFTERLNKIVPMFSKRLDESPRYKVEVSHSYYDDSAEAKLLYKQDSGRIRNGREYFEEVGSIDYNPNVGHVMDFAVDEEHRHMTAHLLAKAWESSAALGFVGPASSSTLSEDSAIIMHRFNPESRDYKSYLENQEITKSFYSRKGIKYYLPEQVDDICPECLGTGTHEVIPADIVSAVRDHRGIRRPSWIPEEEDDLKRTWLGRGGHAANVELSAKRYVGLPSHQGKEMFTQTSVNDLVNQGFSFPNETRRHMVKTCPTCDGKGLK
jgi:hypothetical protein